MRKLMLAAAAVAAIAGGAACTPATAHIPTVPTTVHAPTVKPACQGTDVWVDEGKPVGCDVTPPQTLSQHMLMSGDPIARCQDIGGEPITNAARTWVDCERIDY